MTLEELGLNAKLLVAGFSGGVVHAIVFKQTGPLAVIGSVMAGMLTANFLSPAAEHYLGEWLGDRGCAFIVGLTAMAVCQGVVSLVTVRLKGLVGREKTKESSP